MGTIYSSALQILMFLGRESEEIDGVMEYIGCGSEPSNWLAGPDNMAKDVQHFLDCRYFDRVWILQGLALARFVALVVGNDTTRWDATSIALSQGVSRLKTMLPSALQWHPASEHEQDLLQAPVKSRNCSTTDPRDKVYAILGLV
jgi:hypothetical protein